MNMNISEKWLIDQGFEIDELKGEDYLYKYYKKDIDNVHLTINNNFSNTVNRDFFIHIDNADFESIFSADIQTIEHINKALEFIDCKFRFDV